MQHKVIAFSGFLGGSGLVAWILLDLHGSTNLVVMAHEDCGGNPSPGPVQPEQTREAVRFLSEEFPEMNVVGLWADLQGRIEEIC